METQDYKKLVASMRRELEDLLEKQEEDERKIAQLRRAIVSVAPLAKEDEPAGLLTHSFAVLGMTEGIRDILRAACPKSLTPVEIKEQLKERGQDLSQHKNVMASVHSALKRLLDNQEITTSDEGVTYGWIRRFPRLRRRKHRKASRGSVLSTPGFLPNLAIVKSAEWLRLRNELETKFGPDVDREV